MRTAHKIIFGDARRMRAVQNESVDLVVTSPPYWQLKDYGEKRQIGFDQSYEEYVNHLNLVWAECRRVLRGGCRLCVNIGDQFARAVYYGRYKVIPIKAEIIKFCESAGFDYMGAIIWQKTATTNTTGGGAVMGSFPYPRNGIVKFDYESILLFKKHAAAGAKPRPVTREIKEQSKLTAEEWNTFFSGHWRIKGARQNKHIAVFPLELPSRLIKMFSFAGDTVLDPFLGSGTTSLAAINLRRNSVGVEMNRDFRAVINAKLDGNENLLNRCSIEFADPGEPPLTEAECARAISKLPYVFTDTVKMERKVDPKKLNFGSVIDAAGNGRRRDDFHRVDQVISADKVRLNGGITARLIGIRPKSQRETEAVAFIRKKTDGQKVFMRFDREKYDQDGNLLCYLYLANKTFINAHLIKHGFASADKTAQHRYAGKFSQYEAQNG